MMMERFAAAAVGAKKGLFRALDGRMKALHRDL